MVNTFNPRTWEREADGSLLGQGVWGEKIRIKFTTSTLELRHVFPQKYIALFKDPHFSELTQFLDLLETITILMLQFIFLFITFRTSVMVIVT